MSRRHGDDLTTRLPSSRTGSWFPGAVAVVGLLCIVLYVVVTTDWFSASTQEAVSDVVTNLLALAVPLSSARAARRAQGRNRQAWTLMTLAGALWALGELSWLAENYIVPAPPQPPPSDVMYLLALGFAAAALMTFPSPSRLGRERLRSLLGSIVVTAALLFISRLLAISVISSAVNGSRLTWVFAVAFPLLDVLLASLALNLLIRSTQGLQLHRILLVFGFLYYAIGDTAYLRAAALGTYVPGSPMDLVWALGYAAFVLAAMAPHASKDADEPLEHADADRYTWLPSLLVYLPLLLGVVVAAVHQSVVDPLSLISGSVALLAFGIRQALLAADHGRLQGDLLNRVGQLEERGLAVRQLARQNEQILQSVVDGVLGVDAAGRVTFANDRAGAMLGRPATGLIGTDERELFADLVVDTRPTVSAVGLALSTQTVVRNSRARFRRADGSDFPVELAVGPVRDGDKVTGGVVVFRDVSERLAVEKMKNEFVSVVSHELRTPLTSIRASLGLLSGGMGGQLSPSGERMVGIALGSSERLTRLIEDMLDFERMQSGSLALSLATCQAADLVDASLNGVEGMATQYGMTIHASSVAGWVQGDEDRVVQVLTNLLSNAIKFSPTGGKIEVSTVVGEAMVEFSVADQGRGVPPDKALSIFERFEQVDSSDSRERGGTGLGLAISRDIVRLHGGQIWVEAGGAGGATFRFTVPRARDPHQGDPVDDLADVASGGRVV